MNSIVFNKHFDVLHAQCIQYLLTIDHQTVIIKDNGVLIKPAACIGKRCCSKTTLSGLNLEIKKVLYQDRAQVEHYLQLSLVK